MNTEIIIEEGISVPEGKYADECQLGRLRLALKRMMCGESFIWQGCRQHPHLAAKHVGCKIKTRKLERGGLRVWKI